MAEASTVTLGDLFAGFLSVGLRGFGGVLPWARRMIVEERRWLDDGGFTDLVSLCQLLPGPNIVNLSVALGGRLRGVPGALAALGGLLLPSLVIVLGLGALYRRYGRLPELDLMFRNLGAAAAGLVVATGCKMARPHGRRILSLIVAGAAFVAVAVFGWRLIVVVACLVPVSLWLHGRAAR